MGYVNMKIEQIQASTLVGLIQKNPTLDLLLLAVLHFDNQLSIYAYYLKEIFLIEYLQQIKNLSQSDFVKDFFKYSNTFN